MTRKAQEKVEAEDGRCVADVGNNEAADTDGDCCIIGVILFFLLGISHV